MAQVYASLILKGVITSIDKVPEKIRAEVQAILDQKAQEQE